MAFSNAWERLFNGQVLDIFSASVNTATTVTGSNIFINGTRDATVMIDLTGHAAAEPLIPTVTLMGGVSGFGFVALRAITATADQQIVFRFGSAEFSTGAVAGTTGVNTVNDLRIEVTNSGTVSGGAVTCRAKVILPRI